MVTCAIKWMVNDHLKVIFIYILEYSILQVCQSYSQVVQRPRGNFNHWKHRWAHKKSLSWRFEEFLVTKIPLDASLSHFHFKTCECICVKKTFRILLKYPPIGSIKRPDLKEFLKWYSGVTKYFNLRIF